MVVSGNPIINSFPCLVNFETRPLLCYPSSFDLVHHFFLCTLGLSLFLVLFFMYAIVSTLALYLLFLGQGNHFAFLVSYSSFRCIIAVTSTFCTLVFSLGNGGLYLSECTSIIETSGVMTQSKLAKVNGAGNDTLLLQ